MTSIPEKGVFISRSFAFIFAVSMLFIILSSLIMFQFSENYLVPRSINRLFVLNSTLGYIKHDETNEPMVPKSPLPFLTAMSCKESCFKSNPVEPATSCALNRALVKVFMYDLPPEFHFGLLGWKGNRKQIWPNVSSSRGIPSYPGGLNLQHSIEYWLTLDLLSSVVPSVSRPCTAILVRNLSRADVIFVPFFSSLSYNRHSKIHGNNKNSLDKILQQRLVEYLKGTSQWQRSGGKDHLIVAHHPNSMLLARKHLGSAMFMLADFGRYPPQIANIDKDIIVPYKHVIRRVNANDSPSFEDRPVLVYFQGAIYRKDGGLIRQKLYHLLKDEKDVHFKFGSVSSGGVHKASRGMALSKFCLNIAGDTPSSNRLFDAIASHCIPVIISDDIELSFEDVLDYSKFAVFIRASDALKKGYLLKLLRGVKREKWIEMWEILKQIAPHFEYQYPSQPGDAVDMIWQAVYRKISSTRSNVRKINRYQMSEKFLST